MILKHQKIDPFAGCELAHAGTIKGPIRGGQIRTLHLLALLGLFATTALQAGDMIDGSALITSCTGAVNVTNTSAQSVPVNAHATLLPGGLSFSTGKKGALFMTLSNGIALGLDKQTTIHCAEYMQRPFDQEEQSRRFEASVSRLHLQYEKGQLAIASNQLSPLSDIRIELPFGELRLNKGSCLIRYDARGLHLTAVEGTLTYYYPNSDDREYIAAPKNVRISQQNAGHPHLTKIVPFETLAPEAMRLHKAAEHASRRVVFQPNAGTRLAPEPVLIVRPEYFEQPAFRPYTFED